METAEFTIFNKEIRFHFSDQNLLDLTLGSRGFLIFLTRLRREQSVLIRKKYPLEPRVARSRTTERPRKAGSLNRPTKALS